MASSSSTQENGKPLGKYSRVDEYGFMRDKDFDYKSYENFFSEYTAVLAHRAKRWNKLLNDGKKTSLKLDAKVKRFSRKGIPMRYRKMVWMNVSGARKRMEKNPEVYKQILSDDYQSSPGDQDLIDAIKTDIDRTFPNNVHFRDTEARAAKRQALDRVLTAIGRYKKQIGYCQGMNYVAALLLLIIEEEESVFWLFICLLEDILPEYYSNSMIGLRTEMEVLDALVRERLPSVSSALDKESVNWVLVSSKWFICLYADVLPTETVLRIWDCLFIEGSKILFRVAIAIIQLREGAVKAATDMPGIIEAFHDIYKDEAILECHSFMQKCFNEKIPLRMANIKKLREVHERKIKEEENERKNRKR